MTRSLSVEWFVIAGRLQDKETSEAERERVAYASIDWRDFVVVQTVDSQPGDTWRYGHGLGFWVWLQYSRNSFPTFQLRLLAALLARLLTQHK